MLKDKISAFAHYMSMHTFPSGFNANLQTVKTTQDEQNGTFGVIAKASAAELNKQAKDITTLLDAFEKKAATKLRVHLH